MVWFLLYIYFLLVNILNLFTLIAFIFSVHISFLLDNRYYYSLYLNFNSLLTFNYHYFFYWSVILISGIFVQLVSLIFFYSATARNNTPAWLDVLVMDVGAFPVTLIMMHFYFASAFVVFVTVPLFSILPLAFSFIHFHFSVLHFKAFLYLLRLSTFISLFHLYFLRFV